MKVKLLKKIRKRFSIYRVDKLGSNPSNNLIYLVGSYGLPFYYLEDEDNSYSYCDKGFAEYEKARNFLYESILKKYRKKYRPMCNTIVKVRFTQPKKKGLFNWFNL